MESFTPVVSSTMSKRVRPSAISANLFRDIIPPPPANEKLVTYLRIRAINETKESPFIVVSNNLLQTYPPKDSKAGKNLADVDAGLKNYYFSHIFNEDTSQGEFYRSTALPLVNRSLMGESSLLFAYGTTNSGKSFTMRGASDEMGIIPRAINDVFAILGDHVTSKPLYKRAFFAEADVLFEKTLKKEKDLAKVIFSSVKNSPTFNSLASPSKSKLQSLPSPYQITSEDLQGRTYAIWISYVEFYMDKLKDLLATAEPGKKVEPLFLAADRNGDYYVKGLRHINVSTVEEAHKCLQYGYTRIQRARTLLNQDSSRSHCVLTITIISYDANEAKPTIRFVSNLSFCDLAGNERANRTENKGNRLREAGNINNSLMYLKQFVIALRDKQKTTTRSQLSVVPFRNSPLTKFFKSFLSGTGCATMIVNINPGKEYYDETLLSLAFSADASDLTVKSGKTKRQQKNCLKRLTQQWMRSSRRWSYFASLSPLRTLASQAQSAIEDDAKKKTSASTGHKSSESPQANNEEVHRYKCLLDESLKTIDHLNHQLKQSKTETAELRQKYEATLTLINLMKKQHASIEAGIKKLIKSNGHFDQQINGFDEHMDETSRIEQQAK